MADSAATPPPSPPMGLADAVMLKERESASPPCGASGSGGGGLATEVCVCSGCGGRISDRYYLLAVDRQWHSTCLRCSECRAPLAQQQSCYARGGHIFCKDDYYRLFGVKRCARCQAAIPASELVMRARDLVFHLQCFTCATCGATLARGDHFGVREQLAYCRPHFEQLLSSCCDDLDYYEAAASERAAAAAAGGAAGADAVAAAAAAAAIAAGTPGAVHKGRPRKRKLPALAADASPLGSELPHHPLAMRIPTAALELAQSGELTTSNVESLKYDPGGVPPELLHRGDLSSSMESLSYDVGVPSPGSLSAQSQQRTKRMRTSFKHHQLRTMKSYFAINQNPDAKDLKQLAQKTGLSKRVLQVWFQNARAKWRRNLMRQENGQPVGSGGSGSGGGLGSGSTGTSGTSDSSGVPASGTRGSGSVPGRPPSVGQSPLVLGDSSSSMSGLDDLHHHHHLGHHLSHHHLGLGGGNQPMSLADLY